MARLCHLLLMWATLFLLGSAQEILTVLDDSQEANAEAAEPLPHAAVGRQVEVEMAVSATGVGAEIGEKEDVEFPSMFVLNLDRAPQRWAHMQILMESLGMQVERLSAVDGKALSDAEMRTHSTKMAAFLQPRGVIGCYLSHKRFWQMVVDRNLDSAIIFEDDVRLVDNFKDTLKNYLQRLKREKTEYDVLLLGAIGRVHPEGKESIGSRLFSSYIGGKRPLQHISNFLYKPRRPAGTHAYMVSNAGARRLLGLCPKATFHVDLDAWRHKGLDIQMFYPMLAYQTFESTSLTDVSTHRNSLTSMITSSRTFRTFLDWAKDPYTDQPWSHVFAEPLMQMGPGGFVITVERHFIFVAGGSLVAAMLEFKGKKKASRIVAGMVLAGVATVRGLIWLLMNWR